MYVFMYVSHTFLKTCILQLIHFSDIPIKYKISWIKKIRIFFLADSVFNGFFYWHFPLQDVYYDHLDSLTSPALAKPYNNKARQTQYKFVNFSNLRKLTRYRDPIIRLRQGKQCVSELYRSLKIKGGDYIITIKIYYNCRSDNRCLQ